MVEVGTLDGRLIADASLRIGGIKLRPDNPFTWASGYRMPIYNDNRMLLGSHAHRQLVTDALVDIVKEEGFAFDFIAGTSTAGIAPAASLANRLEVPLVITHDGVQYVFPIRPSIDVALATAVAATAPFGIPYGVTMANAHEAPFLYVRERPKAHGMRQQVEGCFDAVPDGYIHPFLDLKRGGKYGSVKALRDEGFTVGIRVLRDVSDEVHRINVAGMDGLVIEDLISTGGSSAKEVQALRDAGATVPGCVAIFSYDLEKAQDAFGTLPEACTVRAALTYDTLLDAAVEQGYIDSGQLGLLREWRRDPFGWGAKHGFPKVEK